MITQIGQVRAMAVDVGGIAQVLAFPIGRNKGIDESKGGGISDGLYMGRLMGWGDGEWVDG